MSEFTKEELELILEGMSWWLDGVCEPYSAQLIDKIQSMIDNYCEHEFQVKSLDPHLLMMCEKCDKTFVDGSFPG